MKVDALKANLKDLEEEIAQTEKIGLGDFLIAALLAVAVGGFSFVRGLPYLHPSIWEPCAIAGGVRPAASVLPGFFTLLGGIATQLVGLVKAMAGFQILGHLAVAVVAVLIYLALREVLTFIMRARPQYSKRRTFVMRIAALGGSLAFVLADPVWTLGQFFSEDMILLMLTLLAVETFFAFLRKGSLVWAYLCAIILGLLCAETPMGFVLLIAFIALNHVVLHVLPVFESPFFRPEIIAVGKWYMTFLFLSAFVIGVFLNCITYYLHGGLVANGTGIGGLPLAYLLAYWGQLTAAAGLPGWVMLVGICLAPFIVTMVRFPVAADEDLFLSYPTGIVFLVCGAVAFSQSASLSALWFWTRCPVHSTYLLTFGLLLSSATLAGALTILGVDFLCRNHRRLALQMNGRDDELEAESRLSRRQERGFFVFVRRVGFMLVSAVLVLLMIPAHLTTTTQRALVLIRDVVYETMREAGSVEYIFTGGHFDPILELESAFYGGRLKCLPLVGGQSTRDKHLRTRGMEGDEEDTFAFGYDVGMGLRTWIRDKPDRLRNCATVMGFDLWKRDGKPLPPLGGLLSLPTGWPDEATRQASIKRAHDLCKRAHEYAASGQKCPDPAVWNAFNTILWRLARMCMTRAEACDLAGDAKGAIIENDLGTLLNGENEIYQDIMDSLARANERMMTRLTPREGLQLALVRADFNMGKYYAKMILSSDPQNGDANFAMGMYYVRQKQWYRAEEYLLRCLLAMPRQPTIYNNLAMVQLELGKFDAAELNAQKALDIVPDAAAVKETQRRIKKAREAKNAPVREKSLMEKLRERGVQ